MSLVCVEQPKGFREAFLIWGAETREGFDEIGREQESAVSVDELATPLDASARTEQLGFGHLEDPASLHVGEGTLQ
jgi:hypothetical protein